MCRRSNISTLYMRIRSMISQPRLGFLWTALRYVVEKAQDRFKRWTKPATCTLLEGVATNLVRTKPELVVENALLRQQLIVLERQVKHPAFTSFDRGLFVVLA